MTVAQPSSPVQGGLFAAQAEPQVVAELVDRTQFLPPTPPTEPVSPKSQCHGIKHCTICGAVGHRRTFHDPGKEVRCCSICGREGHTSPFHARWEKACALYAEGVKIQEIATTLTVNAVTIHRWANEEKLPHRWGATRFRTEENGVESKLCPKCAEWKPLSAFAASDKGHRGIYPHCLECDRARAVTYARENTARTSARNRIFRAELRRRILEHYSKGSMRCPCCGEDTHELLVVDHIHGGGNAHRRLLRMKGAGNGGFYKWLEKNGYPEGFQVLCHNCNYGRGVYGECPHVTRRHEGTPTPG